MTLHVFVATTQGLVAIQNIVAINDDDIHSLVSVNGTSTTANISGAYHNFVKKGAGIIAQEFGASSYRVNVSERIDQGNSWQLAFYLAHAANKIGILGDGNIAHGDDVLCATGEINTLNQHVLPVGHISAKLDYFMDQLEHFQRKAQSIHFLYPADNQVDIPIDMSTHKNVTAVNSLTESLKNIACLSMCFESNEKVTLKHPIAINSPEIAVKANNLFSKNSPYNVYKLLVALIGLSLLLSFLFVNDDNDGKAPLINERKNRPTIMLTPFKNRRGHCRVENSLIAASDSEGLLSSLTLLNLCKLQLTGVDNNVKVMLIAADSLALRHVNYEEQGRFIPLPRQQYQDRQYFILIIDANTRFDEKALKDYLQELRVTLKNGDVIARSNQHITQQQLSLWLNENKIKGYVYQHVLTSF